MKGTFGLWDIDKNGVWTPLGVFRNTVMSSYGYAAVRALGFGDSAYRINKFYVEYENTAGAIANPTFDKNDLRTYYDNLAAPRDFLRVNIDQSPVVQIAAGYESVFTAGVTGNSLTFRAQTSGPVGMNGEAFSDVANSKVFGVALVASPVDADKTQDVIISRGYYTPSAHKAKQPSGQIGVSWQIDFIPPA